MPSTKVSVRSLKGVKKCLSIKTTAKRNKCLRKKKIPKSLKNYLMSNSQKGKRLVKAVRRTGSSKYRSRGSPGISATTVNVGTRRRGNDGFMYVSTMRTNNTQYWKRA
jgi:hypothetical protein